MKIFSVDLATGEYIHKEIVNKRHPELPPSPDRVFHWLRKLGSCAIWAAYPQHYDDKFCLRDFNRYIREFGAERGIVPPTWDVPFQ